MTDNGYPLYNTQQIAQTTENIRSGGYTPLNCLILLDKTPDEFYNFHLINEEMTALAKQNFTRESL